MMTPKKIWSLYAVYVCGITLFFMVILFPANILDALIGKTVTNFAPDIRLASDALRICFPPGIKADRLRVRRQAQEVLALDSLQVIPRLFSLLTATKQIAFAIVAYDGKIHGKLAFDGFNPNALLAITADFDTLSLGRIPYVKSLPRILINGQMTGTASYAFAASEGEPPPLGQRDFLKGVGKFNGRLMGGEMTLKHPLEGIEFFYFKEIKVALAFDKGTITISDCRFFGEQIEGTLKGKVHLVKAYQTSRLALKGEVKLHPEYLAQLREYYPVDAFIPKNTKKGIPFQIGGTVAQPDFSME